MHLNASNSYHRKKSWYYPSLLRRASTNKQEDQGKPSEANRVRIEWKRIKQIFTNELRLHTIQHSIRRVHDLSNSSKLRPFALIDSTHQRFCARIKMKHFVSTMMKSIHTKWVGVNRHRFPSHNVGDTRRIHELLLPNYYSRRLRIVASLNSWRFDVIEWDYLKCVVAIDVSSTNRIVVASLAHYHDLARFVNEDDNRVVVAKILFRLSLRTKLSYSVAFI